MRRAHSGHSNLIRWPMTPQVAETSGTLMVRPVTSSIERGRIEPHQAQPWESNVEVKYRARRLLKHTLADQFAHVERDGAVVLDGAFAFWMPRLTFRQPLAGEHSLPQGLRLDG